jgi:hypothetical protein
MKAKVKKIISIIIVLFCLLIIEQFLFGALLPYSPVILGFNKIENEKVIIYYHKDLYLDIEEVSKIIIETESFHELPYKNKTKIFLTKSDKEFYRYTFSKFRFLTIKNRILVSGRNIEDINNNKIHVYTYLKHELSHSLIYQNMSSIQFMQNSVPGWLLEGIATYSSGMIGQDSYYSKEKVFDTIKNGLFLNPLDWKSGFLVSESSIVRDFPLSGNDKYFFIYSELGLIIEDLIQRFGKGLFVEYMKNSMIDKNNELVFYKVYGLELENYISQFQERILSHS